MFKAASAKKREKCSVCGDKQSQLIAMECMHPLCPSCLKLAIAQNRAKRIVVCDLCNHTNIVSEQKVKDRVSRKSYKSTQKKKEQPQPDRSTEIKDQSMANSRVPVSGKEGRSNLLSIESPSEKERPCNYHFNEKTHVCLTCLRGVCVRCLQTLCEEHKVFNKERGLQIIRKELVNIYNSKVEETDLKFKQLTERKRFCEQRYQKVGQQIHSSFNHIRDVLARKEREVLDYCEVIYKKVEKEYDKICDTIHGRLVILDNFKSLVVNEQSEIEKLKRQLKAIDGMTELNIDLNASLQMEKFVDESRLQRILFEIEELNTQGVTSIGKQRKYRTSTENAQRTSLKVFRSIPPNKAGGRQH